MAAADMSSVLSSPRSPKPLKPGFYRQDINRDTWIVKERYQDMSPIGIGGFSTVCCAVDSETGEKVALKKLARPFQSPVHAKRAYREIKLLKMLTRSNANVVELLDVFTPNDSLDSFNDIYLVTCFMQSDLDNAIKIQPITDDQVQLLVYQILRGLKYIHSAGVIHRDIKPSNIGVSSDLEIKILDFGLGRKKKGEMTGYVTTRFWRAPEVLLQWMHYDQKVDIWSVGCILAELLTGRVLFFGKNYRDHLNTILQICGTPDEEMMSKIDSDDARTYIRSLPTFAKKNFKEYFTGANPLAVDLLEKLLHLDPDRRPSAAEALEHPYFSWLHRSDDEPICDQQYTDETEDKDLDTEAWKRLIYDELLIPYSPPFNTQPMDTS
ncbi:PREDICTED: mitogen-activated protein kinase 14-like isoform X2 [Amphimedon queenslandica]|uniref:mitogen-activated protein kinase n=1 Tax=Amphimedon queenslandica TaxID=400682 RepID=A0A1X7VJ93_AMPQE|nr:PREDICTED: mitogen-activated protein kinase 14-like isoform X2 [Amphimedon queenslandica]|eukprot:XP_019864495.1 PREDICTED: mitogen-activated protein kinase 14-like isoform X2 [Amphimedon queenslandica]